MSAMPQPNGESYQPDPALKGALPIYLQGVSLNDDIKKLDFDMIEDHYPKLFK